MPIPSTAASPVSAPEDIPAAMSPSSCDIVADPPASFTKHVKRVPGQELIKDGPLNAQRMRGHSPLPEDEQKEEEDDSASKTATIKKQKRIPSLTSRTEDEMWVDISDRRLPGSSLGSLYGGSRFQGIQECGQTSYEVVVDIQHVDIKESTMSGYLNIKGLTTEFPELTTFFEGEIIGPKYSFLTRKWQAEQRIDASHWEKFPSFHCYKDIFNDDDFVYDPLDKDFIYMRWKEHFLVPDHRVDNIEGASFAGFYYICYRRSTNEISGFYFYRDNRDWVDRARYQELKLKHVPQRSFGSFEFR
ncbi:vacuolar import and degradation protein-domain-containing protein [Syncephalastrum racemosum]|uniref:Vacuolar import and degradation protein-domain-containing protein n=1 Tax=Syncephalastrum racemosum TaxID=13706 RepID=A0A1X2HC16_SYNRA|nr:vacuolar import and degradation protein-domain-containing protein [Syncephalastrum racemosum]